MTVRLFRSVVALAFAGLVLLAGLLPAPPVADAQKSV